MTESSWILDQYKTKPKPEPPPSTSPQNIPAPPSSQQRPSGGQGGGTIHATPKKNEPKFDPTQTDEYRQIQAIRNELKSYEGRYFGFDRDELNDMLKMDQAELKKCKTLTAVQDFLEKNSRIKAAKASMENGYAVLSEMKDMILEKKAAEIADKLLKAKADGLTESDPAYKELKKQLNAEYAELQKTLEGTRTKENTPMGSLIEVLSAPASLTADKINALIENWENTYGVMRSTVINERKIPKTMFPAGDWSAEITLQEALAKGQTEGETLAGGQVAYPVHEAERIRYANDSKDVAYRIRWYEAGGSSGATISKTGDAFLQMVLSGTVDDVYMVDDNTWNVSLNNKTKIREISTGVLKAILASGGVSYESFKNSSDKANIFKQCVTNLYDLEIKTVETEEAAQQQAKKPKGIMKFLNMLLKILEYLFIPIKILFNLWFNGKMKWDDPWFLSSATRTTETEMDKLKQGMEGDIF